MSFLDMLAAKGFNGPLEAFRRANISEATWRNLDRYRFHPSVATLTAVGDVLGVTPGQLLDALIEHFKATPVAVGG